MEARGLTLVGSCDLGGHGDGMQVVRSGDALYVGHFGPSGMGTSVLDVTDPTAPRLVRQWAAPPGSHTHKVQVIQLNDLFVDADRVSGGLYVLEPTRELDARLREAAS